MKPAFLALFLLALPRLTAAQSYTVTDLGTLPGGTYSEANAINNLGHVTGDAGTHYTAPDHYVVTSSHVFMWRNGKMHDLGGETNGGSSGNAINDFDMIVGMASDGEGDAVSGAWGSKIRSLPSDYGIAFGLNNRGEVAGENHEYYLTTGHHPFASGQTLDGVKSEACANGLPYDDAEATGINDAGLVVGSADVSAKPGTKPRHAVLWNKGIRQDLGTLPGGTESRAIAVNALGQIIGTSSLRPATGNEAVLYRAFLWGSGRMHDLGTLLGDKQSSASAINAKGNVVGASGERGCLWRGGKPLDLNALIPAASGWTLQGATGINDRGQIVGTGLHRGKKRGFLLTPKL